jgi:hypothetical protein
MAIIETTPLRSHDKRPLPAWIAVALLVTTLVALIGVSAFDARQIVQLRHEVAQLTDRVRMLEQLGDDGR